MTLAGTVLVVTGAPDGLARSAEELHDREGLRVLTAAGVRSGLDAAGIHRPDLVITQEGLPDGSGLELCQSIRDDPAFEGILLVVVAHSEASQLDLAGHAEVDDLLVEPVTPVDLLSRIRSMLRLKRLHDQLRADKLELERLHRVLADRLDEVLSLLVQLVDLRVPGAAARGTENARLAELLADRFDIPMVLRRDLAIAAQVQEIGKVLLATEQGDADDREDPLDGDAWRYVIAARDLLARTEGLRAAADLLGSAFENWDGTGHPDRLRQGQIPLRTRILRVLIDYHALLESGRAADPQAAIRQLAPHSGTRYDPLVIAYFDALLQASRAPTGSSETRTRVPIAALDEGMVLADDLCTNSGVKLLAAGAELTHASLETIRRRHRSDPIVHGVWVRRSGPIDG